MIDIFFVSILLGSVSGLLAGLFGIGGGLVIVPVLALHNVAVEVAVAVAATPLPMVTSRVNIQPSSFLAVMVCVPTLTGLNWFAVVNAPASKLNS